ncbi:Predicted hydrolases of HD superfamily [Phaffia rhodozyma]|uniref:Predicted hydrolases of HD superfamily n=1 Tax=Phaffia rhodozyma TaxID=264483 RepID=A0A0F7SG84_PHARH|nr:Predicted hydrolases of HD superfamily [Phaffia rhodozyma]
MAIVHDLAEAHVGDITPVDGVSKEEKHRREREAMRSFLEDMLHGGEAARRIGALWDEYEDGITPEAKFVKDLDRLELTLQAIEYERAQGTKTIGTFVADTVRRIRHPAVQDWARDALVERTQLYEERGDQAELWQGVDVEKLGEPVVGDWVAKKN